MKIKNLLLSSAILASMAGGAVTAFAADYEDATTATVQGMITFEEDNEPVNPPNPDDPDTPVDPTDPVNPNGAELMISYASKLDFGTQSKSGTSWNALGDEMSDGTLVTPFVATKDSRGVDRKGWTLTAKLDDDFKDAAGNVLNGAELSFSNLHYTSENGAPTVHAGEIVLSKDAQEISSADATTGIGQWSVALGELDATAGTTNGVLLTVPNTTIKNTATYSTSVTYELTADPTNE
ncbi:WxL domain-containing protein [Enterococcus casseliflavus]|uniref:WxL domain-containing protein n=1 Tax=Enterococcus casseliflavus TaxID=37734 RepID=UPI00232FEC30|nr:WxL domain-containing protein [Enterococcus casseliflavus]MDB1688381.1 WxL domain-containing protein [Enterococcus casseliflavus]